MLQYKEEEGKKEEGDKYTKMWALYSAISVGLQVSQTPNKMIPCCMCVLFSQACLISQALEIKLAYTFC